MNNFLIGLFIYRSADEKVIAGNHSGVQEPSSVSRLSFSFLRCRTSLSLYYSLDAEAKQRPAVFPLLFWCAIKRWCCKFVWQCECKCKYSYIHVIMSGRLICPALPVIVFNITFLTIPYIVCFTRHMTNFK